MIDAATHSGIGFDLQGGRASIATRGDGEVWQRSIIEACWPMAYGTSIKAPAAPLLL
jgi:hypothetical protein